VQERDVSCRGPSCIAARGVVSLRLGLAALVVLAAVLLFAGCIRPPRERADAPLDHGYPTCGRDALPEGETLFTGLLRSGPVMRERGVVERFEARRRDCVIVFTGRQDWALSSSDLEVIYDAETLLPIRVWKRLISPGPQDAEDRVETRRFELRGDRVALTQRKVTGELEHWWIRGAMPTAIIGPGRGLVTMWLHRVRLPVGGRVRETVLDVREQMEVIREVSLRRVDDQYDAAIGRTVRVYTIYGREPIYADENDVVIGDMMGLLPGDRVAEPFPPTIVAPGPPEPARPL
jgi:hypothetical protein